MKKYILSGAFIVLLYSCKSSITADQLYGRWKYIKIEIPSAPQYNEAVKSNLADPTSIQFLKDSTVDILSPSQAQFHGHFVTDGYNIHLHVKDNNGSSSE